MRIIAGSAKGRPILAPKGISTRPTLDRVKESLFNILQFSLEDARVLDLYAGSGNLALEALSRGAAFALCNDHDRACCEIIRRNLSQLGFVERAKVTQMDARAAIRSLRGIPPFDIIFLDPPYQDNVDSILLALFQEGMVTENGHAILEHAWELPPFQGETQTPLMRLSDRRKYGDTGISFFERISAL